MYFGLDIPKSLFDIGKSESDLGRCRSEIHSAKRKTGFIRSLHSCLAPLARERRLYQHKPARCSISSAPLLILLLLKQNQTTLCLL